MRYYGNQKAVFVGKGMVPLKYGSLDFAGGVYYVAGKAYATVNSIPGFSITRSTGGYAENTDGSLVYFPPNVARISNRGLLVEESKSNLISNSQKFNGWTNFSGSSLTDNAVIAPDGTKTAAIAVTTASSNLNSSAMTVTTNTVYTLSMWVWVVAGSVNGTNMAVFSGVNPLASVVYPVVTGVWIRIYCTFNSGIYTSVTLAPIRLSKVGTYYLWGAQFEASAYPTSYIPTYDAITNLALQSNTLATTPWNSSGSVSVVNGGVTAPDGTTNACILTIASVTGAWYQTITVTANTTYTFSFYVKLGTAASGTYSVINASAATNILPATTYPVSVNSATWTRVQYTFTTPVGCTSIQIYPWRDGGVLGKIYLWGVQLELGSIARTLTVTTTASATTAAATSATRASDLINIGSSAGFTQNTVKTVVAQFWQPYINNLAVQQCNAVSFTDGTDSNRISLGNYGQTTPKALYQINIGGVVARNPNQASTTCSQQHQRLAMSFGSDNKMSISHNGSMVADVGLGTGSYTGTVTFNSLTLGALIPTGNAWLYGYLSELQLFTQELPQIQLNRLTSSFIQPSSTFQNQFLNYPIGDSLYGLLSTSQAAYTAAAVNDPVAITAAEYANIQTNLGGVVTTGLNNTIMNATSIGAFGANLLRMTSIPSGGQLMVAGYAVAFSLGLSSTTVGTAMNVGNHIGYGTSATGAGVALCNKTTVASNGCDATYRVYYVIKTPSVLVPVNAMPTVFTTTVTPYIFYTTATGGTIYYGSPTDVTGAPTSPYTCSIGLQILQTPNKSW